MDIERQAARAARALRGVDSATVLAARREADTQRLRFLRALAVAVAFAACVSMVVMAHGLELDQPVPAGAWAWGFGAAVVVFVALLALDPIGEALATGGMLAPLSSATPDAAELVTTSPAARSVRDQALASGRELVVADYWLMRAASLAEWRAQQQGQHAAGQAVPARATDATPAS